MDEKKRQSIALMRYSAIAPLVSGLSDEFESDSAYFRALSAKGITDPAGNLRHYAPNTMKCWYLAYKQSGFDALLPKSRSDIGVSRKIDDALQEEIRYMKETYPRMPAAAIYRQLLDKGSIRRKDLSESTVCRFIGQLALSEKLSAGKDMRRYERAHINEVWCGDSCQGLYLKTDDGRKHKIHVIALIDDASRFITGADLFFHDTFASLMHVMKSAVSKYGKPRVFNFDNGSAYRNKQMELLAARIGTTLSYCKPYSPEQKAKIERWFRTLKEQWMASLDMKDFQNINELRQSLQSYVAQYNSSPHSSLKGKSPQDRFFEEGNLIRRIPTEHIENVFLLEIERRVSADCVITIGQVEYEVPSRFARQHVTLRYAPAMEKIYIQEQNGTLTPIRLLSKHENALVKREKLHFTGGEQ